MKNRTIKTNDLTVGNCFLVRGKLQYSRLASQIEGEELAEENARRKQFGSMPVSRAFTSATLSDAEVICTTPGLPTLEEIYGQESLYASKAKGAKGLSYTGINKSNQLPTVAVLNPENNVTAPVQIEGELAKGIDAILVMRIFGTASNNGITLDGVVLTEPLRYRSAQSKNNLKDIDLSMINSLPKVLCA